MTEITKKKSKLVPIIIALVAVLAILAVVLLTVTGSESSKISRKMAKAEKYVLELEYEKAIDLYEQVLEINPKYLDAYLGLADVYMEMDKPEKAVKILEKALKKVKDSDDIEAINEKMREISGPVSEDITDDPGVTEVTTSVVEEEVEEVVEEEPAAGFNAELSDHWKPLSEINEYGSLVYYDYNEKGQIVKSYDSFYGTDYGYYRSYEYYDNGNLRYVAFYDEVRDSAYAEDGFYLMYEEFYNENGLLILETGYDGIFYLVNDIAHYYVEYEYSYNDMGLVSAKRAIDSNGEAAYVTYYEYDEFGNLCREFTPEEYGEPYIYDPDYFYEYVKIGDKFYCSRKSYTEYDEAGSVYVRIHYTYDDYGNVVVEEEIVEYEEGYERSFVTLYSYSPEVFPEGSYGDTFTRTVTATDFVEYDEEYENIPIVREFTYRYY